MWTYTMSCLLVVIADMTVYLQELHERHESGFIAKLKAAFSTLAGYGRSIASGVTLLRMGPRSSIAAFFICENRTGLNNLVNLYDSGKLRFILEVLFTSVLVTDYPEVKVYMKTVVWEQSDKSRCTLYFNAFPSTSELITRYFFASSFRSEQSYLSRLILITRWTAARTCCISQCDKYWKTWCRVDFRLNLDFFDRGRHTSTAVARLPLRQLGFLVDTVSFLVQNSLRQSLGLVVRSNSWAYWYCSPKYYSCEPAVLTLWHWLNSPVDNLFSLCSWSNLLRFVMTDGAAYPVSINR